ncbi:P-type Ca(2+) transporter [Ranunculus cassubicifolius]
MAEEYSEFLLNNVQNLNKPQRKWRLACITICAVRKLFSLVKKSQLHIGYSVIDIQSEYDSNNSIVFSKDDHNTIVQIVREKKLQGLVQFGGVRQVAAVFHTDIDSGISGEEKDISYRRDMFGSNTYRKPKPKGFFHFVLEAVKDTTILILLACATLSIVFGVAERGWKEGWYDGGSIFIAVFLVVVVSSVSNFRQSRQFEKLSSISGNIQVDVMRGGRRRLISIFDIIVGDVVCLKIGDQIPADGLFLGGHSLQIDESSMTGESEPVDIDVIRNPFLLSGAKVVDGYGRMLVTSVGMDTTWGEMMSSITRDSNESTPLQDRLDQLTSYIGKIGLSVAFLVLAVLLARYFTGHTVDVSGRREFIGGETKLKTVMNAVVRIVSDAVTIVVVAIPEGLPLAVTLTLAYAMKRMMADHAMVRTLSACETMGSATTICTDKTGTLTLNQMKVMEFWLGRNLMGTDAKSIIALEILELIYQGVGLNTTGSVYISTSSLVPEFSGSPTEKAILQWAVLELGLDTQNVQRNLTILHVEAFNSQKKRSGVLMRKDDGIIHVHWKGAAEMILEMCSTYTDINGVTHDINEDEREAFKKIIQNMATKTLRCIAFAHGIVPSERLKEEGLTLLGIVGLKDPCRPGVKLAVESCRNAGVNIKMITGDNIFTARAIAIECGILTPNQDLSNGAVVEGIEFRNYTHDERMHMVDKISVMARSSPFDKLLMVQCLKQKGHVVAVTGDGTNDAPALKEADIGLSMGIQGTEVAKESSDIVILDDNFDTVVSVLKWGRCVYTNIQKFIQFQLTVNVAALVINFIAAVSTGEVPLTVVQLLWVNLIMDSLGALALATDRPTDDLLERKPVGRAEPLITNIMWRNLVVQALYQIGVLLLLQFEGKSLFHVTDSVKNTLIFNTFVLCQVFNEFNARKMEKKNVFEGVLSNKLFLGIIGITVVLQVVMVEFLNKFADTVRLNWVQWGICVGIAAVSWPLAWVVKCIPVPDKPLFSFLKKKNP